MVVDMIVFGMAYVLLVYLVMTMIRPPHLPNRDKNDDGDGGIDIPDTPKIDLPPGVIWPSDGPKAKDPAPPMEV
ncbi:hypothetical protein DN752_11595 [Echinicola strongylocentroti]|uniref:Uncharacterized protein n=2 Tax=Echinicola strongylocentroti TaxID=1795355 RepID=A0A2Z4IQY9_9BACT|nr:hypothetical protein DN752_11595 [Echinicola strongylocentroti]